MLESGFRNYSEDKNMLLPAVKRRMQVSILMNTVFSDAGIIVLYTYSFERILK